MQSLSQLASAQSQALLNFLEKAIEAEASSKKTSRSSTRKPSRSAQIEKATADLRTLLYDNGHAALRVLKILSVSEFVFIRQKPEVLIFLDSDGFQVRGNIKALRVHGIDAEKGDEPLVIAIKTVMRKGIPRQERSTPEEFVDYIGGFIKAANQQLEELLKDTKDFSYLVEQEPEIPKGTLYDFSILAFYTNAAIPSMPHGRRRNGFFIAIITIRMKTFKQAVLIILDGWGYREDPTHNAIAAAKTPNFKCLWQGFPHTLLEASGLAVGLPRGQMGNSEIGHTTIGAGKILDTDLVRIGKAIAAGEFLSNPAFKKLFAHVKKYDSTLHVKGLVGTGGVHAHSEHLFAFLEAAKKAGIEKIAIHAFTDGRDTPPQSAGGYLEELEKVIEKVGTGFIATVSGRFYAMDRDNNWDRVKRVEEAIFEGKGTSFQNKKPSQILSELYKEGKLDEHLEPMVFVDDTGTGYKVEKNDGVFFFNFRSDRARQLSKKIAEKKDSHNIYFVTLTEYDKALGADVAFPPVSIETTLATEISKAGLTQAHIAETEKFPHATYFLNGGRQEPHQGESHILLDSRKDVPTHDLAPEMRAEAIADKAIEEIDKGTNFIFINFANPDMVGHTANVPAIITAIEKTDKELGRVIDTLEKRGGVAFVTADHGNAEVNVDAKTGQKHTSHTTNPVPAILTAKGTKLSSGGLSDIAPTILALLGLKQPKSMTGHDLIL